MEILLHFEHRYEVEQVWETSGALGATRKLFFPGGSEVSGRDGPLLKVVPFAGDAWIGAFASGHSSQSLNRVMSCPNPDEMCVIASGIGYIVQVDDPANCKRVRPDPVCDARAIVDCGLLILSDFTSVVAYGPDGFKWESLRVSSDGIEMVDVAEGRLSLVAWSAPEQAKIRVTLSLDDGSILDRSPA
jgi:hypothetical protein